MLVIRLQRTGRKGHAMFRVIVQDSRFSPTSGKVVAWLGSYDPHAKTLQIDKDKAKHYLTHGAQPSERVASLLKTEGIKLPDWVKQTTKKKSQTKNPDKRRSTRPPEPKEPESKAEEASEQPEPKVEDKAETAEKAPEESKETETPEEKSAEETEATSKETDAPKEKTAEAETETTEEKT